MFGKNQIVGRSFFKDAGHRLLITSMFMTLQGEGPFAGMPAFFIRLAKCNLACSFCDTFFDDGDWFEPEELRKRVATEIDLFFEKTEGRKTPEWAKAFGMKRREMVLVITGGEPSLQTALVPFLQLMLKEFKIVQIESNGIQVLPELPEAVTLVVSPKCAEKNGVATEYLKPNPEMLQRADCLKFVMSANVQSPYHKVPAWALDWRWQMTRPVFVSPMNVYNDLPQKAKEMRAEPGAEITIEERSTKDEVVSFWEVGLLNMQQNQFNHEYAAAYCIRHGLRLTLQMHLLASVA